jgi:putative ABC transport system permease protein
MLSDLLIRFRAIFRRTKMESELDDELRFHFDQHVAKLVGSGVSRHEALRRARLEFGGEDHIKEECREARGVHFLETLAQDIRYGLRTLRKAPGFTAVAIITLALGIGANTAIFSYVNAWVIKPLPYPQVDRLMLFIAHDSKKGWSYRGISSDADFFDYQSQNTTFESLVPYSSEYFNLTGDGTPDRILGGLVGWNFFPELGAKPLLGRTFLPNENDPAASHVVILSRGLWESRFAADPRVIGRAVTIQGEAYTVVGVMPERFLYPLMGIANMWAPIPITDKMRHDRENSSFQVFGRMKPGVTQSHAAADLAAIADRLEKLYPLTNAHQTVLLSSMLHEIGENEGSQQVMISFVIVGLVLLIACANVANLMLARTSRRVREFALRGTLGATRPRLIRQLLTESALLFFAGGLAGALVGVWGAHWIESQIPDRIRGYIVNYGRGSLDLTTFAYTFGVALLCGIFFGLAPAFTNSGLDLNHGLKESSSQLGSTRAAARLRSGLVTAEIALAVVVLICSVLLVQDFTRLIHRELGFQPRNMLVTELVLPDTKYQTSAQFSGFHDQVMARVSAIPELVASASTEYLPFGDSNRTDVIHIVGRPPAEPGDELGAERSAVSPNYFQAMQIPLIQGRLFTSSDGPDSQKVVLINETLLHQQFPRGDALGQQLEIGEDRKVCTIVGVVHDLRTSGFYGRPRRQMYLAESQFPSAHLAIVARASAASSPDVSNVIDVTSVAAAVRNAVWSVDPDQPILPVRSFDDLIAESNSGMRVLSQLLGFFGILALLLGSIGIYGVIAYSVQQRIHEIGLRMALGASSAQVIRMILGRGLKLAAIGVAAGIILAAILTRAMASILTTVKSNDPATFIAVPLFFTAVAIAACYLPARRGARTDPMRALKYE